MFFRYLATGVVTGRTKQEVRGLPLPEQEKLEHIDRIHPDKLNNFYQVVSVVCANLPGDAEDEVKGVSTDEESLPKQARWQPPPSGKNNSYLSHRLSLLSADIKMKKNIRLKPFLLAQRGLRTALKTNWY